VEIQYRRGVRPQGNRKARRIMEQVFEPSDSDWRGIGTVPGSGLVLRPQFRQWDTMRRFDIEIEPAAEPAGCICGRILRGVASPDQCALFSNKCTPAAPVGACMVSSEGACQAYFRYRSSGRGKS
ncbi:MAG: hydrogenase formation protein HypD, partial [Gemmatimonadota bacterium]|nr:hydrogenase formation protein HypD [Gemmatimonadota bacterium]